MLIIETRLSPTIFANILHYLKEKHDITPRTRSETLRLAAGLLSELIPNTFDEDEDRAMEYIKSVLGGKFGREERMGKAAREVVETSGKIVGLEIEEAVKKFRERG